MAVQGNFGISQAFSGALSGIVPGGVNSNIRLNPPHVVFRRGKGARLWDVDENDYIDYVLGQGPNFLGIANPDIHRAVMAAAEDGLVYGATSVHELSAARAVLNTLGWADQIKIGMTGTEINQVALRLARAHTGRQRFIRFQGHYHGWLDNVLVTHQAGRHQPATAGQMLGHLNDSISLPWNDAAALEKALADAPEEFAAVIMEPVMLNSGAIAPQPGYLEQVRALCTQYGVVLIFDEVITGFRIHLRGAVGRYGVKPDLATYGKAIAGGWPAAALVGTAELMSTFGSGEVNQSGTFNASVMACAAITAAQNLLNTECDHARIHTYGENLRRALEDIADRYNVPFRTQGVHGAFHASFGPRGDITRFDELAGFDAARYQAFRHHLIDHGLWTTNRGTWYISMAHGEAEMQLTLARFENALKAFVAREGQTA